MYKNGYDKDKMMAVIRANNIGKVSRNNNGNCMYRNGNGNKCLVGCFIPDDLYDSRFESDDVYGVTSANPNLLEYMPLDNKSLELLQEFHDRDIDYEIENDSPEEFYKKVEIFIDRNFE